MLHCASLAPVPQPPSPEMEQFCLAVLQNLQRCTAMSHKLYSDIQAHGKAWWDTLQSPSGYQVRGGARWVGSAACCAYGARLLGV